MILTNLSGISKMSVNELKQYKLKKSILRYLYGNRAISASDLSKNLGISIPTTVGLINDLIERGFVVSCGTGVSTGGRKPSVYSLAGESILVVACDMGRYQAKMAVFDCNNNRTTDVIRIETHIDDDHLVGILYQAYGKLIRDYNIPGEKVVGLGVDMPGLVDAEKGVNYTIKNEKNREIGKRLQQKFHMMVYTDNDARMQAFGEYRFGKAKGCKNALVINGSWGLGLGMILNDRLYRGTSGFAGELSHIQMVEDGDLCICGKRGCFETAASSNTILRLAREGIKSGVISRLTQEFGNDTGKLTPEHVIDAAKTGDEFSISVLNKTGMIFGKGLSYLIQLLNPEIIVLAGPVSKANQFVLTPIQQALNKYCLEHILQNTKVVISDIDEQAGLMGTAAMLYQHFFSDLA